MGTLGVVLGLLVHASLGLLSDILLRAAERKTLSWRHGLKAS